MSDYIYYKVGEKRAKVRQDKQAEFESQYPEAKVYYTYQGRNAAVPLDGVDAFKEKYGVDNVSYAVLDDFNSKPATSPTEEAEDKTSVFETIGKGIGAAGVGTAKLALDLGQNLYQSTVGLFDGKSKDEVIKDEDNAVSRASKKLGELQERLSREADPTGGEKGFVELIREGKVGTALQKALGSGLESLPMMVAAGTGWGALLYGAGMAAGKYADETRENEDIPAWKRGVNAIGSAALEMAVERLGGPLKNIGGKAAKELTEQTAKEIIEDVATRGVDNVADRIVSVLKKTGKEGLEEGTEEVLTSFGNDALGEALDIIDGDKDYGVRAQWEQMKEQNPDADLTDFARRKAQEYMDSFLGGALSGMEISGTAQAYNEVRRANAIKGIEENRQLGATFDLNNMYDVNDVLNKTTDAAVEAFSHEEGKPSVSKEFFDGLSADAAFALSESEDISAKQRAALESIAVAKARKEGLDSKLDARINEKINSVTAIVNEATEDGNVVIGKHNGTAVFVKGGVVKNGVVTLPDGSNGPVIIINETTGEKTTVQSNEITNADTANAEAYSNGMAEMYRGLDQQARTEAANTMSPIAKMVASQPFQGKKVLVNLGNGVVEVYVQSVSPNGEVILKGKKGDLGGQSILTINSDTFYDSIYRDNAGNPVVTEAKEQGVEEQEETPAATPSGADYRGETVYITINGKPVEVDVVQQDNTSDSIVYEYTDENGNRRSASSTIGAFEAAITENTEAAPEVEATEETVAETPIEEPVVEEPVAEEKTELAPEDIDWDNLFEQDKDAYLAELQKQFGEETLDILKEEIETAQSEIDSLSKAKTKSQNERLANRKKRVALQERIDALKGMIAKLTPAPEAEVAEEATVETPVAEDATEEVVETPVAEETAEPVVEETTEEPVAAEPVAEEAVVEEPVVETPVEEPVAEVNPVAPNPVADPIKEAKKIEKHLEAQLNRDLPVGQKQDLARSLGKKVADMFATREEYEVYQEDATDFGAFNNDFDLGVEDSFANRAQAKEGGRFLRSGENIDNFVEQLEDTQNNEREQFEYSDEFRGLQAESARMSEQLVSEKDGVQQAAIRGLVGRIGGTLQRELDRARSSRGYKLRNVVNESKGTSFDIIENVDGNLFHDIFEIVRAYLPNGELVDLHDNYDNATCYITSDGLAGFAVAEDGNLISVFSLYGAQKKGFLGAIKDLITEAGATHLDGYNSQLQPLAKIYSKVFGWKVASMMDYNMDYDHDNIAKNHGMPQVAFMVNTDADIETKHFDKDQYDEAVAYQLEQVEASKQRKNEEISRESENNSVPLLNDESTEEHTTSFERPDNKGQLRVTEGRGVSIEALLNFNPIHEREGESNRRRSIRESNFFALFDKLSFDDKLKFYLFIEEYFNNPSGALKFNLNKYTNELRKNGSNALADFAEQFVNDELKYREGISAQALVRHNLWSGTEYRIGTIEHIFNALNKDEYNGKLFDRVAKLAKRFGVTISFRTRGADGDFINGLGEYNSNNNTITIDANLLAKGNEAELCQTLLHELLHAVVARANIIMTGRGVNKNNQLIDPSSLPNDVVDGLRTLNEVYDAIQNDEDFKGEYGITSLDEMISEVSNPKFRKLLELKNLWKKLKDGILQILGFKESKSTSTNALSEIDAALDKILSSAERGELDGAYASFLGKLADDYTAEDLQNIEDGDVKNLLLERLFMRTGITPTEVSSETAKQVYDRVVVSRWNEFQRQFQDAYQPVRVAVDAIQQETGNIPIEDYENYLLIQNLSSSRSRVEIDNFQIKYYSPIVKQVNTIIDQLLEARGLKVDDKDNRAAAYKEVLNYLVAKHGLERNEYYQSTKTRLMTAFEKQPLLDEAKKVYDEKISQIDAADSLTDAERELQKRDALDEYNATTMEIKTRQIPDMRDYSGLTSLFGVDSKEFEEAERLAREAVDRFESQVSTEKLWAKINAATGKTLKHSYESGLLSRKQYNEIASMFKFYIPLRGFDETTAEDVYSYARFEGNRFNAAVQKAQGRTSLADDPIATIMNMAESEIAQGNKNKAKQALYYYLLNRPVTDDAGNQSQNSLMQIEDVWYVISKDENGNDIYQIAAPDHENGETYEAFENRMQALAEEGKAAKSKKGGVDVGMRFQKVANKSAHYVYLKINGVEKAIYINGDPKAADAINGTYKQKPLPKAKVKVGDREVEVDLAAIQRNISSTFTNYSLEFTARNYFRDLIYSHINIDIRESDPAYRKKFRQNWRNNNLGTMIKMLKAYRAGEFEGRPLTEAEASFVEFMENGGQTGYTIINSVETRKKELEDAIKRMQEGIEKGGLKDSTIFKATLGGIELLNEASELVTRFAAFKTSRDMGRSVIKSINDAKEITVNFNTKGAQDGTGLWGRIAKYLGWSKYFFNASVQGVQNITAMAKANKLKFCTTVGSIVATGFMMPIIISAISEILGGDDEEYWNIPEYDRQNNFCIPLGNGKYAKIPLPIGFREMYAMGDMVAAMAFDKKFTRDAQQIGLDMANKVASILLPINPLESSVNGLNIWASIGTILAPSSAQFLIQNATNTDWKGAPLQKEYTYNENDPQWMKAYRSNPLWMKSLSRWCEENIGAGDMKGWDWSPEKLDNTLSNLFGGVYSLVKKTGRSVSMIWNEESRNLSNIPMTGVVLSSGIDSDDRFVTDAYYEMKEYYDERIGKIKRTAKQFGYDLDDVFKKEKGKYHPKMLELYQNKTFDFMQEWYRGNEELKELQDKVKKIEKKIAEKEYPSEELIYRLEAAKLKLENERREFVDDMLELD